MTPTREDAWKLLCEWTENPNLRKHALGVEAAMRAHARRLGEDEQAWGIVGLIHDFDYEKHPTAAEHPAVGVARLRELGWPEPWLRAIEGHAEHTGVPRDTALARCLFAVDELSGFLVACALVRPDKKLAEVPVASVRKRMKEKSFARSVNRDDIVKGAGEIGMELDEHVAFVRDAMTAIAGELGLGGHA